MKQGKPTKRQIELAQRLGIQVTGEETAAELWGITFSVNLAKKAKEHGLNPEDFRTKEELIEAVKSKAFAQRSSFSSLKTYQNLPVRFVKDGQVGRVVGWSMGGLLIHFKNGKKRGGYSPGLIEVISEKEYKKA